MNITVYTKPNCPQCRLTTLALDKAGLDYATVDLTTDADALDYVRSLGHLQAPVVVTETDHWSGFRREQIKALGKTVA